MPSYSPDGKKIAYSAWDGHDREIYTINADGGGGGKVQVTNNSRNDFDPSYSPDGKKIAYAGQDALFPNADYADYEIYTINAGGGIPSFLRWLPGLPQKGTVRLTNNTTNDRAPSWGKLLEVVKPCPETQSSQP
jgi:Tol biopolymer transport system component